MGVWIGVFVLVVVVVGFAVVNLVMRRQGFSIPGTTPVRCSKGHLFLTTWVEGGSLTAVRLGTRTRYQRCPVGDHWAIIHPVKEADLSDEERHALHSTEER
jgi:hypothetical protein